MTIKPGIAILGSFLAGNAQEWKGTENMRQERLMILEKVLSELPGYLGWMIGSCRFSFGKEAGGNTPGQMQHSCDLTVLRSDARLAEVEIRNLTTEDQLRVMLVNAASGTETDRETTGKQHRDIRLPSSQKESEAFLVTREAIDTYLKESRDGNLIHRGEAAVVPGFLMVNRLLEGYGGCDAASVRFYLPLRCGEKARLVEQKTGEHSRTVELFTDRGRILQMKLQEKNEGGTE